MFLIRRHGMACEGQGERAETSLHVTFALPRLCMRDAQIVVPSVDSLAHVYPHGLERPCLN